MTIVFVLRLSCYFVKILSSWYEFYGLVKNTNDLKSIYITIFTEYKNQNMTFQLLIFLEMLKDMGQVVLW